MSDELKRATELWVCGQMKELVGGAWYPSKGGTDTGEVTSAEPPFGFVMVTGAENLMVPGQGVWRLAVKVCYLSHLGDGTVQAHSAMVHEVEKAVGLLMSNAGRWNPMGALGVVDAARHLIVHGCQLVGSDEFSDAEEHTRGDVFTLTMGVSH